MNSKWNDITLELFYDYGDWGNWIKFTKLFEEKKSQWQTIRILEHPKLGKTLLLDEDIQGGELDNSFDDAVIELIPPESKHILILGGGDCSLATRLCEEENVEKVTVCDIDKEVYLISEKYFPIRLNEKVNLVFEDGFDFIKKQGDYDLIIDDMLPVPHNRRSNYWFELANTFKGKWIISQTGSHPSEVPELVKRQLTEASIEFTQISRFVMAFLENWTFTKYKLPLL